MRPDEMYSAHYDLHYDIKGLKTKEAPASAGASFILFLLSSYNKSDPEMIIKINFRRMSIGRPVSIFSVGVRFFLFRHGKYFHEKVNRDDGNDSLSGNHHDKCLRIHTVFLPSFKRFL